MSITANLNHGEESTVKRRKPDIGPHEVATWRPHGAAQRLLSLGVLNQEATRWNDEKC